MKASSTRLLIRFTLSDGARIEEAIGGLPKYSQESFREQAPGQWHGDFIVSCPVAPDLAEGDIEDELAPHFPSLLNLKQFHDATFELQVAVGAPGPEVLTLKSFIIAMLAALQAEVVCIANAHPDRVP